MSSTLTRIGPYEVQDRLGSGGMGVVFRAKDSRLHREVAIKLLPEEFLGSGTPGSPTHERFLREARAASSLNHPNICTIYDVGEVDGKPYLVMELLQGEDLKAAIAKSPIPVSRVIDFGIQLSSALAEAHSAGIVHRDIKPANIFVVRGTQIKVLDFGLAKQTFLAPGETLDPNRTSASPHFQTQTSPGGNTLTTAGSTIGTVAYMSPEQARGQVLDAQTDIFSMGSVLYEMATGKLPFAGDGTAEIFASLLKDEPESPRKINPAVPRGLEAVILKCLAKDKSKRYSSAAEVRADLEALSGRSSAVNPAANRADAGKRSKLIYAGAGLLSLLLIAGALYWWHSRQSKPSDSAANSGTVAAASAKDSVILADFVNNTGDPVFDTTLNQALSIQLQQSPVISIVSANHLRQSMRYLGRSPDEKLTPAIAREIGEREGVKAILTGTIASLGKEYIVTLAAQNTASGDDIASEQAQAPDKEHVLDALDKAATAMRARLGESLSSIQKLDTPFGQATTKSLEAFRAYALGDVEHSKGLDIPQAEGHYQRAVEIDPDFAMAWARLGVVYGNAGATAKAAEYYTKAYNLSKNVSEREKFYIDGHYYDSVLGNLQKTGETLELATKTYPKQLDNWVNLSVIDSQLGQSDKAIDTLLHHALVVQPDDGIGQLDLIEGYINLDRLDEAKKAELNATQLGATGGTEHLEAAYELGFLLGDKSLMDAQVLKGQGRPDEFLVGLAQAEGYGYSGQHEKAQQALRRAAGQASEQHLPDAQARLLLFGAGQASLLGLCGDVPKIVKSALQLDRTKETQSLAATISAACGDTKTASSLASELARNNPEATLIHNVDVPEVKAWIALHDHKPSEAIEALEVTEPYDSASRAPYLRGLAYLDLNDAGKATASFQKALQYRGRALHEGDYPQAQLGLARAYAMAGNKAAAKKAYQDFFTTWKDADADLPQLIAAKKEFAAL